MPAARLLKVLDRFVWFVREVWIVFRTAIEAWLEHGAMHSAAALAFYTIFSVAPALLIAVSVAGLVVGRATAQSQLSQAVTDYVGPSAANLILKAVEASGETMSSGGGALVGVIGLLTGATVVFGELRSVLNKIWGIQPKPFRIGGALWSRLLAFLVVLGVGVFLMMSVFLSTALSIVTVFLEQSLAAPLFVLKSANFGASLVLLTVLFACLYKALPDTIISWRNVFFGGFMTAILFLIGKWVISLYLSSSLLFSLYGAAASLVLLLAWVYYSTLVLFFGAELTQVYARRYGPSDELTPPTDPAAEGATPEQDR